MAKNWGESFGDAFTQAMDTSMKIQAEKEKEKTAAAQQEFTNYLATAKYMQDEQQGNAKLAADYLKQGYAPSRTLNTLDPIAQQKVLSRLSSDQAIQTPLGIMRKDPTKGKQIDTGMVDESGNPIYKNKDQATFDRTSENYLNQSWDRFLVKNNPETASSRSTLGQVSNANLRANRALSVIDNPTLTRQDLQAIIGDWGGIMQQGSPTDQVMKESDYKTMYGAMQNIKQFVSGNPQESVPPKIKQHIKENLKKLQEVDNWYLKNHLEGVRKTHGSYFKKKAPERWQGYEDIVNGLMTGSNNQENTVTSSGSKKSFKQLWKTNG